MSSHCWPPMVLLLGLDSLEHQIVHLVSFYIAHIFQEGILSSLWFYLNVNKKIHGNLPLIWNSSCSTKAPPRGSHTLSWGSASHALDQDAPDKLSLLFLRETSFQLCCPSCPLIRLCLFCKGTNPPLVRIIKVRRWTLSEPSVLSVNKH